MLRFPVIQRHALAVALYTGLTVLLTWPQAARFTDGVMDLGDPLYSSWCIASACRAFTKAGSSLFDPGHFHPQAGVLTYSDSMVGQALLALPLWWAGVGPVALHSFVVLLSFVLSGYFMFLLARDRGGSTAAALVAGALYAFSHYRFGHLSHLVMLSHQWVPLVLLGLHRLVDRGGRPGDALLLAAALAMLIWSSGYYAIITAVAILAYGAHLLIADRAHLTRRVVLAGFVAAGLAVALVLPVEMPYFLRTDGLETTRDLSEVKLYSAQLTSYLAAPRHHPWLGPLTAPFRRSEGVLFPGFLALALAPLAVRARKGTRGFYLALVALGLLCSLGPAGRLIPGVRESSPFLLLRSLLPGFDIMRVPARFALLVNTGLVVLGAMGLAALFSRWPARRVAWVTAALLVGVALEQAALPLPLRQVKGLPGPADQWLARHPQPGPVLYLPAFQGNTWYGESRRQLGCTAHWRPMINGYSSYARPGYWESVEKLNRFPEPVALREARRLGARFVVIEWRHLPADRRLAVAATRADPANGLAQRAEFQGTTVLELLPPGGGG